ncbi:GH116 family glycosyl-hydrolase [Ruania albidiflava]|uniref:GH116 family glycosyl-hydrolase n=1 Tax=Ruania albidiflava TaxID=366586 RepID=UPI0023F08292|nr:GH116 family glycosyl-hydrolase [Ruania albidiflava]
MSTGDQQRPIPHTEGRHVAMPLGGIGTGNLALGADGGLRQWQLHNIGNHRGELPGSFFAVRVSQWEPPFDAVRVLQAPPAPLGSTSTPLVTDDVVPRWQRDLLARADGVASTTFTGTYPFGRVEYHDDTLPVQISLEAFTPLVPLDVDRSSLPAALFTFTITNTDSVPVHGWLGAGVQNAVGGDGVLPPDGVHHPGYGGNTNRVHRSGGWTSLLLENQSLSERHPGAGQMVLTCDAAPTAALPAWTSPQQLLDFLASRQPFAAQDWAQLPPDASDPQPTGSWAQAGPSPAGSTWNAALAGQFTLAPGESSTVRLALTWHFPNRQVNFTQFGGIRPEQLADRAWLGNYYTTRYPDALAVAERVQAEWHELERLSRDWTDVLGTGALRAGAVEHLAAQAAVIRSPSFFRTADGHFFGFEGVHGASTLMWSGDVGGSCPLNCTHVFNYVQAVAHLFPEVERDMRELELDVLQAPEGFIPHRLLLPLDTPQLWDREIGGPGEPALDGMLGTVLKTYREVRAGAGQDWLARYWPRLQRLLHYVVEGWDPQDTGVLHGIQPSTHDIDLAGVNSFMGTLWLAALRAAEEMALLLGDRAAAQSWRERFETASRAYDEALFTGEYYVQVLEDGDPVQFQWGRGCLSDQLIGQWWAHQLDLGHLLPADHVRTALRAVVQHNLRTDFTDFEHGYRVFADRDETGLLVCTWPHGGRPEVPTRYCDEVWTGTEQQVAAHCLAEGLVEEGNAILEGLWSRYDGRRRNPYNQVECGDHYVRALSGWSVLGALTGHVWDATSATLHLRRPPHGTAYPVLTHTGWGTAEATTDGLVLTARYGQLAIDHLALEGQVSSAVDLHLGPGERATVAGPVP